MATIRTVPHQQPSTTDDARECFLDRVCAAARERPASIAYEHSGTAGRWSLTYAQLLDEAAAAAGELRGVDVQPGERVALFLENHPRWCTQFLGILACRATAVPLDVHYGDADLIALLTDCRARVVITSLAHVERFQALRARIPTLEHVVAVQLDAPVQPAARELNVVGGRPEDTICLLYTSGTTGDPKGVMISNANVLAELDGLIARIRFDHTDSVLSLLPLTHVLALLTNVLFPLIRGARTVFIDQPTSASILRGLVEGGISVFGGVPQVFYLLHARIVAEVRRRAWPVRAAFQFLMWFNGCLPHAPRMKLGRVLFRRVHASLGGRLRLLYSGGSYLDPAVARDFHRLGFDLVQAYGLTETTGVVTVTPVERNRHGTVGPPLAGVEVRLGDAASGDGCGEILVRGPTVMAGYFEKPEHTAQVLREGWFHTGDLGSIDAEGNLRIVGRCKDMIVLPNGKNVYPDELERAYGSAPYVKEVCVLGVPVAGGRPGEEELHAVVVPDFDALKAAKIASVDVQVRFTLENVSAQLAAYKRVRSYELRTQPLPRTTTRKIRRHEVLRDLRRHTAPVPEPASAPRAGDADTGLLDSREGRALVEAIREAGRDEAIRPDDHLELDLKFDSLARIELLANVEKRLGVQLDPETAGALATVGEMIRALRDAPPAADQAGRSTSWHEILLAARDDPQLQSAFDTTRIGTWTNGALRGAGRLLFRTLLRVEVSGREHIPRQGPCLICPNHQSYLDGFILPTVLPSECTRHLFTLADSSFFRGRLGRWFARWQRIVTVDADANLLDAMRYAAAGLGRGRILCIFPEGERSIDGSIRPFRKGAAVLAREFEAPIVPVAIAGTYHVWSRASRRIRLHKVRIRFGPPIDVAPFVQMPDSDAASAELTRRLQDAVTQLLAELEPAGTKGVASGEDDAGESLALRRH